MLSQREIDKLPMNRLVTCMLSNLLEFCTVRNVNCNYSCYLLVSMFSLNIILFIADLQ